MLNTGLLVASVLFSCLALVLSLWALVRYTCMRRMEVAWRQLEDAYTLAAKTFDENYVRIDGDLDRIKDRFELHLKAFTRFRSRVTMGERRQKEQEPEPNLPTGATMTEEERNAHRLSLHNARYGIAPTAAVPRNIEED